MSKRAKTQLPASRAFFDGSRPFPFTTAGETKARILDAARRCLLRTGAERLTMADVARSASYSRPTVYKYFPDRKALMRAVMEEGTAACNRDVVVGMAKVESLPEKLISAVEVYWEWQTAARRTGFMTEEDFALVRGDVLGMEGALDGLEQIIETAVVHAQQRGEIRTDVEPVDASLWLARIVMSLAQDRRMAARRREDGLEPVTSTFTFVMEGLVNGR
jgi:AcrR family transcriptional regulator